MRIAPAVAAVPLLILLLTWLSVRAVNTNAERFDVALGEMDRFGMLEAALHRDVLSARVGTLRDYDPLVQETNELDAALDHLKEIAAPDATTEAAVDRLATSIAQQEHLVEQFKSDNALLQNSLAYFSLFSFRLASPDRGGQLEPAISALTAAMLRLTLDTSPETVSEVQHRLDDLAGQHLPADGTAPLYALLAHGRLLRDLLPATDGILKALGATPARGEQSAVRAAILARQAASRATARQFREVLYFVSLLLVAMLAYGGWQLRARAQSLQLYQHPRAGSRPGH
jgi:DAHL domain